MKHKHHIIPKHAGGDPKGERVELTVEEHAKAHHQLWLKEGREYDRIAWLCLSGQIGKEEARILAVKAALTGKPSHRRGKKLPEEHRKNMRRPHRFSTRKPLSEEHKQKISLGKLGNQYASKVKKAKI